MRAPRSDDPIEEMEAYICFMRARALQGMLTLSLVIIVVVMTIYKPGWLVPYGLLVGIGSLKIFNALYAAYWERRWAKRGWLQDDDSDE